MAGPARKADRGPCVDDRDRAAKERTAALTFICSDMWQAYSKVVAKKAGHALHILDRFHIAQHLSAAIDRVRRAEVHS